MNSRLLWIVAAMLGAVVMGCQKNDTAAAAPKGPVAKVPDNPRTPAVEPVKDGERSKNFAAVNKHLELGGTMYGYVDVDGDLAKVAGDLQRVMSEAAKMQPAGVPAPKAELGEIARMLGLTDVKALGVSSVQDETGYFRNRMFVYTGTERRGLFAAFGGKPAPFKHLNLAPADASFFGESEIDVGVIYKTLKEVVEKTAGEPVSNQLEGMLKKAGDAAAFSFVELIHGLKGRSAVVLRLDAEKTMRLPNRTPFVLPAFSLLVCVEGVGSILEDSFTKDRNLRRSEAGTAHIYTPVQRLPFEGIEPALIVDGSTLFVTTSLAFYNECREGKSPLAQNADFKRTLQRVGNEGNGLAYVTPQFFARLRDLEKLNPQLGAQEKSMLSLVLSQVPVADHPLVSIRTNLDEGILFRSYWNRSLKQEMLAVSVYNPVTVGLLAAMAIPAFQKVRIASQEKAIMNNLRQLAAAADQHYLETGTRTATYDQIVGPTKYVKRLVIVAGENYRSIQFVQGEPLRVRMSNGKVLEYKP